MYSTTCSPLASNQCKSTDGKARQYHLGWRVSMSLYCAHTWRVMEEHCAVWPSVIHPKIMIPSARIITGPRSVNVRLKDIHMGKAPESQRQCGICRSRTNLLAAALLRTNSRDTYHVVIRGRTAMRGGRTSQRCHFFNTSELPYRC